MKNSIKFPTKKIESNKTFEMKKNKIIIQPKKKKIKKKSKIALIRIGNSTSSLA